MSLKPDKLTACDVDNHYDSIMDTRMIVPGREMNELMARFMRTFSVSIQKSYEHYREIVRRKNDANRPDKQGGKVV